MPCPSVQASRPRSASLAAFDAGERGGTVEQAPLSPLLRAAIDAFDEAGPDAAFEQGLAVIVDGLAKRRLVVRNVEGPRKGDD